MIFLVLCTFIFPLQISLASPSSRQDGTQEQLLQLGNGQAEVLAWNPSGDVLAVGSTFGTRLYDGTTFEEFAHIHDRRVDQLNWSADGQYLAITYFLESDALETLIWDMEEGEARLVFDKAVKVKWSPQPNLIAVYGHHSVSIWDIDAGGNLQFLSEDDPLLHVHDMAWNRDGTKLVTLTEVAQIWDVQTGNLDGTLSVGSEILMSIAWGSNDILISGASEQNIYVWDARTHELVQEIDSDEDFIRRSAWDVSGTRFVREASDHTLHIWDIESGTETILHGHITFIPSMSWKPDGTQLASSSIDGIVRIWDVITGEELFLINQGDVTAAELAWHPYTEQLAMITGDQLIQRWDIVQGELLNTLHVYNREASKIDWSADGTRIVVRSGGIAGGGDSIETRVQIWDVNTGQLVQGIHQSFALNQPLAWRSNYESSIRTETEIVWAADQTRFATVQEGGLDIWQVGASEPFCTLAQDVGGVAWSADGMLLAFSSRIWNVNTCSLQTSLQDVFGGAWSSTGHQLVIYQSSSETGQQVLIMDGMAGEAIVELNLPEDRRGWMIQQIEWRGAYIILDTDIVDLPSRFIIWQIDNDGEPITDTPSLRNTRLNPNANLLAGIDYHQTEDGYMFFAIVWDIDTRQIIAEIVIPHVIYGEAPIQDLSWSPDGQFLAMASLEGPVYIWIRPTE